MKNKGFTLIELLIVISIISVLSTIGAITYQGVLAKGRDSVRKQDLNHIAIALEAYAQSHNGKYVPGNDAGFSIDALYSIIAIRENVPKDPKTGNPSYWYVPVDNRNSFRLFAKMENCDATDINHYLCQTQNYNYSVYSDNLTLAAAPGDQIASASPSPTPSPIASPAPTPTATSTPTPLPYKRVFVTSIQYNGNLGGLAGADAKCQTQANTASLGGNWQAWLSDSNNSASSRLIHFSGDYRLIDGITIVANSWSDLTNGTLDNPIKKNEFGQTISDTTSDRKVWTNTREDGNISSSSYNCSSWISNSSSYNGNKGDTYIYSSNNWTENSNNSCDKNARLYCFEQ